MPAPLTDIAADTAPSLPQTSPPSASISPRRRWTILAAAIVGLALAGAAGFLVGQQLAPTDADAAKVKQQAHDTAFEQAEKKSYKTAYDDAYKTAFELGKQQGAKQGKAQGAKAGTAKGKAAGTKAGKKAAV